MNLFRCMVLRGFEMKIWYIHIETYCSLYYYLLQLYSFGTPVRPKKENGGQVFKVEY